MVVRITPAQRQATRGHHPGMERAVAISAPLVGSTGLYSAVVTTEPGGRTRIHHHGECETSIYVESGRARFSWGPTGLEETLVAEPGDFVYIPAGTIHVEENASESEDLVVVLSRNCPDAVVFYLDDAAEG
ncbi:MAG: cupin domain-containing protein [Candidatus Limnocylindrales bacterium]